MHCYLKELHLERRLHLLHHLVKFVDCGQTNHVMLHKCLKFQTLQQLLTSTHLATVET